MIEKQEKRRRDSALEWALLLAQLGFLIIPLQPRSKLPVEGQSWKVFATRDPKTIRQWLADSEANFGVCPGERHVIIDLDRKESADGVEAFGLLELGNGSVDTFAVTTPSGGRHLYLRVDRPASNSHDFPAGIDVRGAGGYVVGPGCVLTNGKAYVVENPDFKISNAPEWISQKLKGRTEKSARALKYELDTPGAIVRAIDFLKKRKPAIEGEGGDSHTLITAMAVMDFGLSEEKTLELMQTWNERCEPPWPVYGAKGTLEEKVRNAWRYRETAPGSKGGGSGDEMFAGVEERYNVVDIADYQSSPKTVQNGPLSAAELAAGDFPRAEHLWQDFILLGHPNTIDGDGGVGKTQLLAQLAVAVAAGESLFGHEVQQMPVLLALCEDTLGETKHRLTEACLDLGVDLAGLPLHIWCRPGEDSTLALVEDNGEWRPGPFYKSLSDKIAEIGPCFVGLDTISDVAVLDENKRLPMNTFAKQVLGAICQSHNATILITRHPSKSSMSDGTFYSGSTAANAAFRNRLLLNKAADRGGSRTLKVVKSNYGLAGEVELNHNGKVFQQWGALDKDEREKQERAAVLAVTVEMAENGIYVQRGNGQGQKPKDVAEVLVERFGLKLSEKAVRTHLNALEREGALRYEKADNNRRGHQAGFRKGRTHPHS